MIEKIKAELFKKYKNDDIRGLFFSLFDAKKNLILSNGVLKTDKTMDKLVDTLYYSLMDKIGGIKTVVIDVVMSYTQETDLQKLLSYSTREYGFCLIGINDQTTGVILPDTTGVNDVRQALNYIKQKNGIAGNAEVYLFKTDRIAFDI